MQEQHRTNEQIDSQNVNKEEQEQPQVASMFWAYQTENGQTIWGWLPEYYQFFDGTLRLIQQLRYTVDKKWKEEHKLQYERFLTDLEIYINTYVITYQITDFNAFIEIMNAYSVNKNPIGRKLYDTQIDYLQKKSEGYDFKLDKKKKKIEKPVQSKKEPEVKKVAQKKQEVINRKNDPEINIQALMSTQWPAEKYINIEVFKKQNVNMVFIGHVDAGKSSITGNILKELGEVDEQELARNKQDAKDNHMEAYELAGITDVDPNERKKGKTVECAKVNFFLENKRFTVFDAPGHKNYVPNMIMGACQADIAVLIISSKQGQFESGFQKQGQTKEHAMLAKALGVNGFIVAVTKMTLNDWSEKRFNHIKEQVTPFLQNSCGFSNVQFVPVDSLSNLNIHKKVDLAQSSWYKGRCLLDILNTFVLPERKPLGPLRIPLIDKFKEAGNFYLYGKIQSGTIIEDQTITILPPRKQAVIKEIFNAKDERLPFALAGENVKIKVKGIQENDIKRGDILCNNLNYCLQTYEFKANIHILELPQKKKLMAAGYQCVLHMHAIAEEVQVINVEAKLSKETKKNVQATFLRAGEEGVVTIKCENILCVEKFEFMSGLGRFTLRDEGKTIGYGTVMKIKPAKTLLQEQKKQSGLKKDEKGLEGAMGNLNVPKN